MARGVAAYYRVGDASLFRLDASQPRSGAGCPNRSRIGLPIQNFGYQFHGFAPNQLNSDLKFYDYGGALNDTSFSDASDGNKSRATAGFLTQADPSSAGNLLVALPALSWDYERGLAVHIFLAQHGNAGGSDQPLIGNTGSTSANGMTDGEARPANSR